MRVLGIDFGENRTGIAISDPLGWTAQGLEAVSGGINKTIARIVGLAHEMGIQTIVVGYPLNMNGTAGPRAERTDAFITALKTRLAAARSGGNGGGNGRDISVVKLDERLSSKEAARTLELAGVRPTARSVREKGKLDIMAATIILQNYLDRAKTTII